MDVIKKYRFGDTYESRGEDVAWVGKQREVGYSCACRPFLGIEIANVCIFL